MTLVQKSRDFESVQHHQSQRMYISKSRMSKT